MEVNSTIAAISVEATLAIHTKFKLSLSAPVTSRYKNLNLFGKRNMSLSQLKFGGNHAGLVRTSWVVSQLVSVTRHLLSFHMQHVWGAGSQDLSWVIKKAPMQLKVTNTSNCRDKDNSTAVVMI